MLGSRDSQKSKVYAAEGVLHKYGGNERLETVEEIQEWLMKLSRYKWFTRRWPSQARWVADKGWDIRDGRGTRIARGGGRRLNLPKWARTKATILHELAHCLAFTSCPHGWQFAQTLRLLARFVLGKEAEKALVASYKQHRVRYRKPRKKVYLTQEQRAALAQRMAVARAARGRYDGTGTTDTD